MEALLDYKSQKYTFIIKDG